MIFSKFDSTDVVAGRTSRVTSGLWPDGVTFWSASLFEDNFFELTQSRMAPVQGKFAGLAIPMDMRSNVCLVQNREEKDKMYKGIEDKQLEDMFQIRWKVICERKHTKKQESKTKDDNVDVDGLRNRKIKKSLPTTSELKNSDEEISAKFNSDPLSWCGFAVSSHVKVSQNIFKKSLIYIAQIADINRRIMILTKAEK